MIFWSSVTISPPVTRPPECASAENGVSLRSGQADADDLDCVSKSTAYI
jgi:hypothetical protein